MKRALAIVAILIVGAIGGSALATLIHNTADDLPQYAPDRIVEIILERGTIIGGNAGDLPPAKGMVITVFDAGEKTYYRQIIESPRYALLITVEDERVIEAEIWDRTEHDAIFYEIDSEAMERYAAFYPANRKAEQD